MIPDTGIMAMMVFTRMMVLVITTTMVLVTLGIEVSGALWQRARSNIVKLHGSLQGRAVQHEWVSVLLPVRSWNVRHGAGSGIVCQRVFLIAWQVRSHRHGLWNRGSHCVRLILKGILFYAPVTAGRV